MANIPVPAGSRCKSKTVRFSQTSQLVLFNKSYHDIDKREIWYSNDDYKAMKKDCKQATFAAYMRGSALASSGDADRAWIEALLMNEVIDVTGLEKYVCKDIFKQTTLNRMLRLEAVFMEQERQDQCKLYNPDELANASQHYSELAVKRARVIGLLNTK